MNGQTGLQRQDVKTALQQLRRERARLRVERAGFEPWRRYVDRAEQLEAQGVPPVEIDELLRNQFGKVAA
jgi:hypothetical protein